MHHQGTNSGSGSGAANRGTTPPSIAPAPPPQSPQGQQQVQATQVQMQQQQQGNSGGAGGNAGGGQGGQASVQQQQNVAPAPNNNMTTMAAAAIQQTQMQQQQQQMAPPQAPTPQTLTHPHSAMHQVSEWGHGRVQVIQQPLQNPTYLQQIYNTQGQLLMPGNIALHPAGMNPSIQVIAAGKPFQPNQLAQHMITTQGKSVLQGQAASFPGYATIPTTSNQTLVISQLGVISSQPNILPAHAHGQGGKPGDMQKIIGAGGKSNMVSSNGMGGGAVGNSVGGAAGGVKGANNQQQQQCVVSQPQLITTQAPTAAMLGSQAQLISPIQFPWQAFGTPGIAWATPGGLQSPAALLTTPNPIFIRGAQPHDPNAQGAQGPTATQGGVFIQSPPPQAMATHNATLAGTPTAMQTANNAANAGAGNQGNGNTQQHQAQQAQPQITHQIHHQHQLAMKVASVGTGSNRVGTVDGGGGTAVGGTTMQANIQPKTSAANNVLPPRSMPGILPGSAGVSNNRPASSVSTQTGSSGGPGGMGMGQLQMQKGLSKVRIKPTMNRASPAPSMKADAANQTKPQPISPANMQHQGQQLTAVAAQVSVANRMILTNASNNGAPLLPDKGQQLTLQAVKSFTSSAASTTSTTTSTSTSCSPAPTLPILPPLGHPTATAVLLPHPSLQAQLIGQAACPASPSGTQNGPNVSVASPMRPVGAPTPSGIVASLPVSISLQAPPSSPSQHLHPSQHQIMGPPMVAMVTAAPSPNQGMQNVSGSTPPVSVVTSSTGMGAAAPGTVLSVVPGGIVNNQVPGKEDSGAAMSGEVTMNNVGDANGSMMVVPEERRNGEASPAGVTPMEGVVETGVATSQSSEVNGEKEKLTNGIAEPSSGNTAPMEGVNTGEEGGTKSDNTSAVTSGVTNGPTSGASTGMAPRDTHKVPPPKALVKPQVLTHVIEGFVIQEASEPFAVNRSSLLSEMPQPSLKPNNQMLQNHTSQQTGAQDKENVQHHVMANHIVSPSSNDSEEPPKKKLAQEVQVGVPQTAKLPADLAKCEFCGKVDLRSKFKKSKRFCTLACAKSKRLGLYKPEEGGGKKGANAVEPNNASAAVNAANAKEQQAKTDWQKSKGQEWNANQNANGQDGGRLGSGNVNAQEEGNLTTDNETNDSSGAESSSLSPSDVVQGQETSARTSGIVGGDPSDDNNSSESGLLSSGCQANATPSTPPQPRINPIKWTVSDVCEFIRNLPGCSDYAEDFAIQEIDGQALLLLKEDHLMTAMSMKLGPALKICARIDTMRGDMKEK